MTETTRTATRRAAVVRVQSVRERTIRYDTAIAGPDTLASAARALIGDLDREGFAALHLD